MKKWRSLLWISQLAGALVVSSLAVPTVMAQMGPSLPGAPPPRPRASADIWSAQDGLVARSIAQIPARAADRPNVYAVAIAPLGTQTLFSREAKAVLQAFAANFGGTAQAGILLSNLGEDHRQVPLATRQNIGDVLGAIGARTRASPDDLVVVYLTSHGSPDATLQSELVRSPPILPISADSMRIALDQAGIRRRVIIVSACFAGSWIPRLATDDTIIITAAAADRTSFGCADHRPLTYFGEAFLTGPFARGASLQESFEGAKVMVTKWEQDEKLLNSLPQAYVGKNMQSFWQTPLRPEAAKPAVAQKAATAQKVAARP